MSGSAELLLYSSISGCLQTKLLPFLHVFNNGSSHKQLYRSPEIDFKAPRPDGDANWPAEKRESGLDWGQNYIGIFNLSHTFITGKAEMRKK